MSTDEPTDRKIAKSKKTTKDKLNLLLKSKFVFLFVVFGKCLSRNSFVNLTPKYETAIPATTSVKKCAPTTILLKAIVPANKIKKYLSFGKRNEAIKATTNIVEVCPEGKE